MFIPRYWRLHRTVAKRSDYPALAHRNDLRPFMALWSWGYSDRSAEEAEQAARDRVPRLFAALSEHPASDADYYPSTVVREEILQRVTQHGEDVALITRNRYHAHVLNTARMMFVDIDLVDAPLPPQPRTGGLFEWLWHNILKSPYSWPPPPRPDQTRIDAALAQLREYTRANSTIGFRVYETYAGLRLLVTTSPYDPRTPATEEVFDALGADTAYRKLCQAQNSFRARLTPKF